MPMKTIEDIIEQISPDQPQLNVELIRRASQFNARAHGDSKMSCGTLHAQHGLEVASILTRLKVDETTLVIGLLHDVVSGEPALAEELSAEFGSSVFSLVEITNKISSIPYRKSNQQQVESFRKMFVAMARDLRVILVCLADRLSQKMYLENDPRSSKLHPQ